MKIFPPIEIDIDAELGRKNPKRVLPQIEGLIRVAKTGFLFEGFVVVLLVTLIICAFRFDFVIWPILALMAFFAVAGCINFIDEINKFRYLTAKSAAIRSKIEKTEQGGDGDAEEAV